MHYYDRFCAKKFGEQVGLTIGMLAIASLASGLGKVLLSALIGLGLVGPLALLMAAVHAVAATVATLLLLGCTLLAWPIFVYGWLRLLRRQDVSCRKLYLSFMCSSPFSALCVIPVLGWYLALSCWGVAATYLICRSKSLRAVLVAPGVLGPALGLLIILYTSGLSPETVLNPLRAAGPSDVEIRGRILADYLNIYARRNNGQTPLHSAELILPPVFFPGKVLVIDDSDAGLAAAVVADASLAEFFAMTPPQQRQTIDRATSHWPVPIAAHRLGDFVFCYHGMTLSNADRRLWIALLSPEFAQPKHDLDVWVVTANGSVATVPSTEMPSALKAQNELRIANGLPALPDLRSVRSESPIAATGSDNE